MTDPTFPRTDIVDHQLADQREVGQQGAGESVVPGVQFDEGRTFRIQDPKKPTVSRNAISWGVTIVVALLLTMVVKTWIFQAYSIPSESMVPTLLIGDRVLVSKLNRDPGRGDVVVFNRPPNDPARGPNDPPVLIKRVIGLPGETITAQDGSVYVNGQKLVEDYLPKTAGAQTVIQSAIKVPNGQLLVLGDNRSVSFDGRSFGTISKDLIVGRAVLRIWPLSRFGSI